MKAGPITSAAQDFRGDKNNVVWLQLNPENDTEIALTRALSGSKGSVYVSFNGSVEIEFKIPCRKRD